MNLFTNRHFAYIVLIIQCVLWYIVKDDPFFGDAIASTSVAANAIFDADLQTIFYPVETDPGHPTLYAYALAVLWKLFGRSLWVTHVYGGVWALVLVFVFRKIARTQLSVEGLNKATLLVAVFATYLSQSAMVLNTMAFTSFFLFAVYGILQNQRLTMVVWMSLMCCVHLQSSFMLVSLAAFDVWRNARTITELKQWMLNRWWVYSIPFLCLMTWLFIHHQHTGWYMVSPNYSDHQELNTWKEVGKALLLIIWRLIDYGMLPFYLVLLWVVFKQKHERYFLFGWFVLLLPCWVLMAVWLNHTIGHRYFLGYALLAILLAVKYTLTFKPIASKVVYGLMLASLCWGNFWLYPGKTLGDATLAYRGYFKIEQQLHDSLGTTALYSYAPIAHPRMLRHLAFKGIVTERLSDSTQLDCVPVILQSNINAEFTDSQKTYLINHFRGRTFQSGAVYVNVFYNPVYFPNIIPNLRKPTASELWMEEWKAKLH